MIVPSQQEPLLKALKAAGTHTFTCAPAPMQHALSQVSPNYHVYNTMIRKKISSLSNTLLRQNHANSILGAPQS